VSRKKYTFFVFLRWTILHTNILWRHFIHWHIKQFQTRCIAAWLTAKLLLFLRFIFWVIQAYYYIITRKFFFLYFVLKFLCFLFAFTLVLFVSFIFFINRPRSNSQNLFIPSYFCHSVTRRFFLVYLYLSPVFDIDQSSVFCQFYLAHYI